MQLCQLEEAVHTTQPSELPPRAWQKLATDFWGPFPNGHELLVVQDRKSRFVVVYEVTTTAGEYVIPKLEELFSLIGIPEELLSDNGPPFNGQEFAEFAAFMGFKHRKITPEHPQANGMAEKFMVSLGKVIRNAQSEQRCWRSELQAFLRSYRSTPHRTTGVAPSEALFGNNHTSRLPPFPDATQNEKRVNELLNELQRLNDVHKKEKSRAYTDLKRKAMKHNFKVGEKVLFRQKRLRKAMMRYADRDLTVIAIKSSMIIARDADGSTITRDASRFKRKLFSSTSDRPSAPTPIVTANDKRGDNETAKENQTISETTTPVRVTQKTTRRPGRPVGSTKAKKAQDIAQRPHATDTSKRSSTRIREKREKGRGKSPGGPSFDHGGDVVSHI